MIDFIISNRYISIESGIFSQLVKLTEKYSIYYRNTSLYLETKSKKLIIIGDCINSPGQDELDIIDVDYITNSLKGNFYAFFVTDNDIFVISSAFGLLPVYYNNDFSFIASSVDLIKKYIDSTVVNKQWIINQLLFNYQFGNDTYYNEIKLLPSFSYLKLSKNKNEIIKHFDIASSFVKNPIKWNKSIHDLSDLFIETTKDYIPDKDSVISFTGGFDGRTIVSVATYYNKSFETFSFGKKSNDDVSIPLKNAAELNIPYFWMNLGDEYASESYLNSAKQFIEKTGGANGLLYAHVDYAAGVLAEKTRVMLSGLGGSELFRAAHSSGAVTSKALLDLFRYDDFHEYRKQVLESTAFQYLNKELFKNEIEEVIEKTWTYKQQLPQHLDKNQKLYVFVYEEIFRKFFGAWVADQMNYLNIRTPYLDFGFFKEVIKTEFSGAYSDFLTENPLKRFKGQVLYAEVIRKTNKKIYNTKTGKGYPPRFIREPILRPALLLPFIIKRLKRKVVSTDMDNLGIISGVKNNRIEILQSIDAELFNKSQVDSALQKLSPLTKEQDRDALLWVLSMSIYRQKQ